MSRWGGEDAPGIRASQHLYGYLHVKDGDVRLYYVFCGCPAEGARDGCPHNWRLCRLPGRDTYRRTPASWRIRMIGGTDTVVLLGGRDPAQVRERVVRHLFRHWPRAVAEDGEGRGPFTEAEPILFHGCCELFVYRDEDARSAWAEQGATPETEAAMVHVLLTDTSVTLVSGTLEAPDTHVLIEDLRQEVLRAG